MQFRNYYSFKSVSPLLAANSAQDPHYRRPRGPSPGSVDRRTGTEQTQGAGRSPGGSQAAAHRRSSSLGRATCRVMTAGASQARADRGQCTLRGFITFLPSHRAGAHLPKVKRLVQRKCAGGKRAGLGAGPHGS